MIAKDNGYIIYIGLYLLGNIAVDIGLPIELIVLVFIGLSLLFFGFFCTKVFRSRKHIDRPKDQAVYDMRGGARTYKFQLFFYFLTAVLLLFLGVFIQIETDMRWLYVVLGLCLFFSGLLLMVYWKPNRYFRILLYEDRLRYLSLDGVQELRFSKSFTIKSKGDRTFVRDAKTNRFVLHERDFDPLIFAEFKSKLREQMTLF